MVSAFKSVSYTFMIYTFEFNLLILKFKIQFLSQVAEYLDFQKHTL